MQDFLFAALDEVALHVEFVLVVVVVVDVDGFVERVAVAEEQLPQVQLHYLQQRQRGVRLHLRLSEHLLVLRLSLGLELGVGELAVGRREVGEAAPQLEVLLALGPVEGEDFLLVLAPALGGGRRVLAVLEEHVGDVDAGAVV